MKTYPVDEAFIKEAYNEACGLWKAKIMRKFPEVFSENLIGKKYIVRDLSYHKQLEGLEKPLLRQSEGIIISKVTSHPFGLHGTPKNMIEVLVDDATYLVFFESSSVMF